MIIALFIVNFRRSTTGLALNAARWSEAGAKTSGISVVQQKVIAGALAALIAGIGGGLFALSQSTFQPSEFATFEGVVWLAVLVTWGVRSNAAALLGGVSLALLPRHHPELPPELDVQLSRRCSSGSARCRRPSTPTACWPSRAAGSDAWCSACGRRQERHGHARPDPGRRRRGPVAATRVAEHIS